MKSFSNWLMSTNSTSLLLPVPSEGQWIPWPNFAFVINFGKTTTGTKPLKLFLPRCSKARYKTRRQARTLRSPLIGQITNMALANYYPKLPLRFLDHSMNFLFCIRWWGPYIRQNRATDPKWAKKSDWSVGPINLKKVSRTGIEPAIFGIWTQVFSTTLRSQQLATTNPDI